MLFNAGMFQVSSSHIHQELVDCQVGCLQMCSGQMSPSSKQQVASSKQILRWRNGKCKQRQGKARVETNARRGKARGQRQGRGKGETKELFLVGANSQPQSQPRVTEKEGFL